MGSDQTHDGCLCGSKFVAALRLVYLGHRTTHWKDSSAPVVEGNSLGVGQEAVRFTETSSMSLDQPPTSFAILLQLQTVEGVEALQTDCEYERELAEQLNLPAFRRTKVSASVP